MFRSEVMALWYFITMHHIGKNLVNATPPKPLVGISWNLNTMLSLMLRYAWRRELAVFISIQKLCPFDIYTPAKRSLQGVYWKHCVSLLGGWSVGRSVTFHSANCSESLCRKLLLHLLSDWLQTWNMTSSWVVDVQDTNFMFSGPSLPELCALELSNMVDRGIFGTWKFVS